ncbi:hypothetical protein Y032_0011g1575 [Ancylostoma ceylanicum]|uniref:Uncharacterized protein n=1 Tax=Ancylostoma ceylanicum TaxID=53326 RepID=A0A016VET1_9BILA|nr:hypothetical protein Y032_0011g1575 [Ancylostoma ceylanicum]
MNQASIKNWCRADVNLSRTIKEDSRTALSVLPGKPTPHYRPSRRKTPARPHSFYREGPVECFGLPGV